MRISTLRSQVNTMPKAEFISLRDKLETNWSEDKRPLMQVLSLGSLKRFKITLAELT